MTPPTERERIALIIDDRHALPTRLSTAAEWERWESALAKADAILSQPAPDREELERAAYKRGWDDREADFLAGVDRVAQAGWQEGSPNRVELENERLKAYGYAPGNYMSKCDDCGSTDWDADKRARRCRPCAVIRWNASANLNHRGGA